MATTGRFIPFSRPTKSEPYEAAYHDGDRPRVAEERGASDASTPPSAGVSRKGGWMKSHRRSSPLATDNEKSLGHSRGSHHRYLGSFAPNPSFLRLLRFLLYALTSASAIVTAFLGVSVVAYYNTHEPSIKPAWSSLVALIVFGLLTPLILTSTFLITPKLFRYGSALGLVNLVKVDLLLQFTLVAIWISTAIATASDMRGYENCIWDGYYHYPKPSNFNHVCDVINSTVIMGYITMGLIIVQWLTLTLLFTYILLYLDQDVLSELTNDMGGRAFRARTAAMNASRQHEYQSGAYQRSSGSGGRRVLEKHSSRLSRDGNQAEQGRRHDLAGSDQHHDEIASQTHSNSTNEGYYGYETNSPRHTNLAGIGAGAGAGPMMLGQQTRRDGPWSPEMRNA